MEQNTKKKWWPTKLNIQIDSDHGDVVVKYPLVPTEFDIQYELYSSLSFWCGEIDDHTEIKSEVTVIIDGNIKSRFDLMLFKNQEPVCAIEVKKDKFSNPEQYQKQLIKYQMFQRFTGVPVIYCYGQKEIEETIEKVKKMT